MCGIAGILNFPSTEGMDEDLVARMLTLLQHRGPDENGIYLDPMISLGHTRLSIIGIKDGIQPIANEDESLWIVYNGEVFNYLELKKSLQERGHRFRTQTDTEVILHLYEDLGAECLSQLNGQFALAIWDARKRELFLARDRVGIRPLYYTTHGGRFLFASEIKALFLDPRVPRRIDPRSLAQVFSCWTTIGSRTIFEGVHELCPGHWMTVKEEVGEQRRFWSIPYYPREARWQGSKEEAAAELRSLLEDSVRLRLRAEVPVGAYLSGGLDSSIITSIIARKFNNRLKSFSLSFEEKSFDEAAFQAEMVSYLGSDHQQTHISNRHVRELFPQVIWHCEKPLLRTSPVPLFILSKLVRDHQFKVVLTGEGADEVFGGYNIFKEAKVRTFWGRQPQSQRRPLLLERLYPYIFRNPSRSRAFLQKFFAIAEGDLADPLLSHRKRWENTAKCLNFFSSDVLSAAAEFDPLEDLLERLPADFAERDVFARAQWLEMDIFMSNYLLSSQGDRVAMANSVEIRLPFLDFRVIDFAARLPPHWKIQGLREKDLLKKAFRGRVPENILNRAKQPYRAPIAQALGHDCPEVFADFISPQRLEQVGLFNEKRVTNLLGKYRRSGSGQESEVENMALAGILSTQMIHEQFIEGIGRLRVSPARPDKIVRRDWDGRRFEPLAAC